MKIGLLYYSGKSPDLKDNEIVVKEIQQALEMNNHTVYVREVNEKNWQQAVKIPGNIIINLVEDGDWKLYRKIGIKLEKLGKIQVGHDKMAYMYAINKTGLKNKMRFFKVATPAYRIIKDISQVEDIRGIKYPVIVKPAEQHAGVGISQDSVVIDKKELSDRVDWVTKNIPGDVLVEEYIDGREIHVTVLGNGNKLTVLPYCELLFKGEFENNWEVYSYEAKWEEKTWEYWNVPVKAPAPVSKILDKRIRSLAIRAFNKLQCVDVMRFDMRIDAKEKPYIIDVNYGPTLGRDEFDATWVSAQAAGWTYEKLIEKVVDIAGKRGGYQKLNPSRGELSVGTPL